MAVAVGSDRRVKLIGILFLIGIAVPFSFAFGVLFVPLLIFLFFLYLFGLAMRLYKRFTLSRN